MVTTSENKVPILSWTLVVTPKCTPVLNEVFFRNNSETGQAVVGGIQTFRDRTFRDGTFCDKTFRDKMDFS